MLHVCIISDKYFLVKTRNFTAFYIHRPSQTNQWGPKNESQSKCVCNIMKLYVCIWKPPIHTDCQRTEQTLEKRGREKKRGEDIWRKKRAEMRIQPLFSLLFSYLLIPSPLSSPSHCIYNALSLYGEDKTSTTYQTFFHSAVSVYETLCITFLWQQ